MPGYWDGQRYVTSSEAEGRQRPFDRGRKNRLAVGKQMVEFGQGEQSFADAGGERDLVKAAAKQMISMNQHADDPQQISAALAERGQEARELGLDVDSDPYVNSELMGELAQDADQLTSEVRQEREADEAQEAFDDWLDRTFDVDELRDHVASLDGEDQRGLVDELVNRFEEQTGIDAGSIATDDLEPEFQPYAAGDDDDYE